MMRKGLVWARTFTTLGFISLMMTRVFSAVEITPEFEAANRLYEEGKFEASAAAYEAIIESGPQSSAIYFNLGNAWFRAGKNGRAIAAYRKAEQLNPRGPDIQANLKFVISKATGKRPEEINPNRTRFAGLTLNEWTWLSVSAVWICMMLLAARELRPNLEPVLKTSAISAGALAVITVLLAFTAKSKLTGRAAVIVVPEAVVRYGPLEESQSAFTLPDGFEVSVIDAKDGWLRVSDSDSRTGWVKETQVLEWQRS